MDNTMKSILRMKEDRLEQLLRHRHYSRPLQHQVLIPMLLGFKETVQNITTSHIPTGSDATPPHIKVSLPPISFKSTALQTIMLKPVVKVYID